MDSAPLWIGIGATGDAWSVTNDEVGIETLLTDLRSRNCGLVVLEATGGFETPVVRALAAVAIPVVVANPRQVRNFARTTGQLANTDRLDARSLALFAERIRPEVRALPDDAARMLDALPTRRRQISGMIVADRNRHGFAPVPLKKRTEKHTGGCSASSTVWMTISATPFRRALSGEPMTFCTAVFQESVPWFRAR